MLARIRAQAKQMQVREFEAMERGDLEMTIRYRAAWKKLMKQALEICVG